MGESGALLGWAPLPMRLWENLWRSPRVLFASSEVAPLVKTGGLADVSHALPAALARHGCDVRILMPGYRAVRERISNAELIARTRVLDWDIEVLETELEADLSLWLLGCPALFDRPGDPYRDPAGHEWPDNAERFACFGATIAWLALGGVAGRFAPNIVHLNDWQTGLAAPFLADHAERPGSVFSVHNLEYQGLFGRDAFDRLRLPERLWAFDALEFHGQLSFIKGGLQFADYLTTVSATYAREIQTPEQGRGLEGLLKYRGDRLVGIVNGIDDTLWDPTRDPLIPHHFDLDHLHGKALNKLELRERFSLNDSRAPLIGIVSRLASQKGMDLVLEVIDDLVVLPAQLVVLGSGDRHLEQGFTEAAARHPGAVAFDSQFDERLAHLIEAGADLFLMPSRFEPCGLNQMYSMRYGTVPVVRRTGGLADTVEPVRHRGGTGFVFDEPSSRAMLDAVRDAVATFGDSRRWRAIQRAGMRQDFSWGKNAAAYRDLYVALLAERAAAR